jgi:monofunctional biosynthetic peptidoglycan transglycosylase
VRWTLVVVLVLLLLPYLITLLYLFMRPVSTPMVWRWMTGARVVRTYVPLDAIAPALPLTVIGSEDARFCRHRGVDWKEVASSIENAEELADLRGASTITQQTAKNLFLWPGRSFVRKVLEFPLALWVDFVLPKRRVMEIYLNIAEWGPNGEFGAEAAARAAFGVSARELTNQQAALLAAVLPNPIRRSAKQPRPASAGSQVFTRPARRLRRGSTTVSGKGAEVLVPRTRSSHTNRCESYCELRVQKGH